MPSKIKLIRSVEYLYAFSEGDVDLERSKEFSAELAKAKHPSADFDVILDFRHAQIMLSATEIWFLAAELAKNKNRFRDKVAVLTTPGLDFNKAEFFELCSKNRGYNVDVFTKYEDAVQWFSGDGTLVL